VWVARDTGYVARDLEDYVRQIAHQTAYVFHVGLQVARLRSLARRREAMALAQELAVGLSGVA